MKVCVDIDLNLTEQEIINWFVKKFDEIEKNHLSGIRINDFDGICEKNGLVYSDTRNKFQENGIMVYHEECGYLSPTILARNISAHYRVSQITA